MLLALDTSTRQAGIALYSSERGLLAETTWHSANRHTEELMPAIDHMLAQAGLSARDLTAVGVALGPGSFTGLRVGLAAAKGLALAHGLKLVGVPTLDFTAYPHRRQPLPAAALIPAGRGRLFWAIYAAGPDGAIVGRAGAGRAGDDRRDRGANHAPHPVRGRGVAGRPGSPGACRGPGVRALPAAQPGAAPARLPRRAGLAESPRRRS